MQKSKSIAPFFIGQEVVSVVDGPGMKKGDIKKVISIWSECCVWLVDVGLISSFDWSGKCCHGHRIVVKRNCMLPVESTCLAPITPKFETIEYKEVLEKEKEFVGSN